MRNPVLFLLALLFTGSTVLIAQQPLGEIGGQTRDQENHDILVIHKEPPVYPKEAKAKGISGAVTVEVLVDKQGNLSSIRVIEGDKIFSDAVLACVKRWKFQPAMSLGQPVEKTTRIKVGFCPTSHCGRDDVFFQSFQSGGVQIRIDMYERPSSQSRR